MSKKRKKKLYNTPLKEKHIHKTPQLASFIKSFENPKCSKCQSFLASHLDRDYCGKCCSSEYI